jgi:hypothetical protein
VSQLDISCFFRGLDESKFACDHAGALKNDLELGEQRIAGGQRPQHLAGFVEKRLAVIARHHADHEFDVLAITGLNIIRQKRSAQRRRKIRKTLPTGSRHGTGTKDRRWQTMGARGRPHGSRCSQSACSGRKSGMESEFDPATPQIWDRYGGLRNSRLSPYRIVL